MTDSSNNMEDVIEDHSSRSELLTLKEVYLHSVALAAQSIPQFSFYEDDTVSSGVDRYMLLDKNGEPAVLHVTGKVTHLTATPAGAVQNRKPNAKVDEYQARLRIEEEKALNEIESGISSLMDLLKGTAHACANIAVSSGVVESRKSFRLEEVTIKLSNYSNDIFYFNREVASKEEQLKDDSSVPDFLLNFPKTGKDYPELLYPKGWNSQPLIPVTDTEALQLNVENITLPRRATDYFELRQWCYNFHGHEGPVRQIVLILRIVAIKVYPRPQEGTSNVQKAKRRRLSR